MEEVPGARAWRRDLGLKAQKRDADPKVLDNAAKQLEEAGLSEGKAHRKIYRPWGNYTCVEEGNRWQVKRIQVKPSASLSLQMHHHRAEHWVVVKGTALVEKDGEQDRKRTMEGAA